MAVVMYDSGTSHSLVTSRFVNLLGIDREVSTCETVFLGGAVNKAIGGKRAVHRLLVDYPTQDSSTSREMVEVADLGEEGEAMPNDMKDRVFPGAVESTGKFWATQGGRHVDVIIGIGDFDLFPVRIAANDKMLLLSSSVTGRLMVSGKYLKKMRLNLGPPPPPPLEAVAPIGKSFRTGRMAPRARFREPGCFLGDSSVPSVPRSGSAA